MPYIMDLKMLTFNGILIFIIFSVLFINKGVKIQFSYKVPPGTIFVRQMLNKMLALEEGDITRGKKLDDGRPLSL